MLTGTPLENFQNKVVFKPHPNEEVQQKKSKRKKVFTFSNFSSLRVHVGSYAAQYYSLPERRDSSQQTASDLKGTFYH